MADSTVVLITGISSGIGKALALRLIKCPQYIVYGTVLPADVEKGKVLSEQSKRERGKLHVIQLDVTDTNMCAKAVETVVNTYGRLDILVNNAGYMLFGASEFQKLDSIKALFDCNVFGAIDMSQRVLPLMRKRKTGRIINISSLGGVFGQAFGEAYCSSKFALEGYTQSIARYYRSFGVHVCSVCPGSVKSGLKGNMLMPNMDVIPSDFVELYGKAFEFYTTKNGLKVQEVDPVIDCIIRAMTDETPKVRYITNPELEPIFDLTCGKNIDGEAAQALSDDGMFNNWKEY